MRLPEETLLIEWPKDEAAPTKFWLAAVDQSMSFRALVDLAKLRWRIERDYQELKQEIGLGVRLLIDPNQCDAWFFVFGGSSLKSRVTLSDGRALFAR